MTGLSEVEKPLLAAFRLENKSGILDHDIRSDQLNETVPRSISYDLGLVVGA